MHLTKSKKYTVFYRTNGLFQRTTTHTHPRRMCWNHRARFARAILERGGFVRCLARLPLCRNRATSALFPHRIPSTHTCSTKGGGKGALFAEDFFASSFVTRFEITTNVRHGVQRPATTFYCADRLFDLPQPHLQTFPGRIPSRSDNYLSEAPARCDETIEINGIALFAANWSLIWRSPRTILSPKPLTLVPIPASASSPAPPSRPALPPPSAPPSGPSATPPPANPPPPSPSPAPPTSSAATPRTIPASVLGATFNAAP